MLDINRQLPEIRRITGEPDFNFTAGIETGECLVGSFGTEYRKAYTVIGTTANRAAKYQAAAKELAGHLVIGPQSWLELAQEARPQTATEQPFNVGDRLLQVRVVSHLGANA